MEDSSTCLDANTVLFRNTAMDLSLPGTVFTDGLIMNELLWGCNVLDGDQSQ